MHWIGGSLKTDLKELIGESHLEDFALELVASDTIMVHNDDSLAYLATLWVFYDDLFTPTEFAAAYFRIDKEFGVELQVRFGLNHAPTFTSLVYENGFLFWMIFCHSAEVFPLQCIPSEKKVLALPSVSELFPTLDTHDIPGSAIRCEYWTMGKRRFSIVGFDTGYVVASVQRIEDNFAASRKTIKFSGPVSVLNLIQPETEDQPIYVVISSTIGPAAVWELRVDVVEDTTERDEVELEVASAPALVDRLSWIMKCELGHTEVHDCVITGAVTEQFILIGTYGEQLLIYSLKETTSKAYAEPIATMNVASPILSIVSLDFDNTLAVLSSKGFHQYVQLDKSQMPIGAIDEPTAVPALDSSPKCD